MKKVYHLDRQSFADLSKSLYKENEALKRAQQTPTRNDVIRIFHVVLMNDNRDNLEQLNSAKTYKVSDLDTTGSVTNSVFHRLADNFNDPDLKFYSPDRSIYLMSFDLKTTANDEERIAIGRNGKWLKDVYFKTLKEYRKAMEKWKMGTGGGSGQPENYCDWNTRNDEEFSNYGNTRGDVLAYVYMLDKESGFPLLTIYDDAPDDVCVEDGTVPPSQSNKRKRSKKEDDAVSVATSLCAAVTDGFKSLSSGLHSNKPIVIEHRNRDDTSVADKEDRTDDLVEQRLQLISNVEGQIEKLKRAEDEGNATKINRRIAILERTVDMYYDKLDNLVEQNGN